VYFEYGVLSIIVRGLSGVRIIHARFKLLMGNDEDGKQCYRMASAQTKSSIQTRIRECYVNCKCGQLYIAYRINKLKF
jgi:hypothetical protein